MGKSGLWAALAAVTACGGAGGETPQSGQCEAPIAGTYVETDTRDPANRGDCPASIDDGSAGTVSIGLGSATLASVAFQGASGSCPATIAGCKLTAACAGQYATIQLSWTFDGSGFTGYTSLGLTAASPAPGAPCSANYNSTGLRK